MCSHCETTATAVRLITAALHEDEAVILSEVRTLSRPQLENVLYTVLGMASVAINLEDFQEGLLRLNLNL